MNTTHDQRAGIAILSPILRGATFQFLFLCLVLNLAGCSKKDANDQLYLNLTKFSFGKVARVSKTSLQVREYDFAKDADVLTTYLVTSRTEFENMTNLADLHVDDDVVINYAEKGPTKVATTLLKERKPPSRPTRNRAGSSER
jgi:hypothetical protein